VAIHGYRQLSKYFIQKFKPFAERGIAVVAPEGLNRFYIEGYSGRVGANWMTKEDRETDIEDYLFYLNSLLQDLRETYGNVPFHLLGFSQGGATASRWFASNDFEWKSFSLYASVFPNDFDFEGQKARFESLPSYLLFGDSDPFADEATIASKTVWLAEKGINPKILRFEGGHDIYPKVLEKLATELGV
jgi:predicted esterase